MSRNDDIIKKPNTIELWWIASRPYSLSASAMPVLFGTVAAITIGGAEFHHGRFLAALIGMMLLHVGANLMNDAVDYKRGIDKRVNPVSGAVVRGWITPAVAGRAAAALFIVGGAIGLGLAAVVGISILWIGLVGTAIGLLYTAGRFGLKYHAIGDVAVFLDFGILGALGAWTVQTGEPSWIPALWAVPMSLLVIGILHANNWRDIEADTACKARTVASILGDKNSAAYFAFLLFTPFALILLMIIWSVTTDTLHKMPVTFIITFFSLPLAISLMRTALARKTSTDPSQFLSLDGATGKLNLVFGFLCTAALGLDVLLLRIF